MFGFVSVFLAIPVQEHHWIPMRPFGSCTATSKVRFSGLRRFFACLGSAHLHPLAPSDSLLLNPKPPGVEFSSRPNTPVLITDHIKNASILNNSRHHFTAKLAVSPPNPTADIENKSQGIPSSTQRNIPTRDSAFSGSEEESISKSRCKVSGDALVVAEQKEDILSRAGHDVYIENLKPVTRPVFSLEPILNRTKHVASFYLSSDASQILIGLTQQEKLFRQPGASGGPVQLCRGEFSSRRIGFGVEVRVNVRFTEDASKFYELFVFLR